MKLELLIVLLLSVAGFAADQPLCASYTESDIAFAGKVIKIENAQKSEGLPEGTKKIRFQVTRNFKGADNPTIAVFSDGTAPLKTNQNWIVFAGSDIVIKSFAIKRLEAAEAALTDELAAIATGNSYGSVAGRIIPALSPAELAATSVVLVSGGKRSKAAPDANGFYNFPTPDGGRFRVELLLPFAAAITYPDNLLGVEYRKAPQTFFAYDVRLGPGDCSYTKLDVAR